MHLPSPNLLKSSRTHCSRSCISVGGGSECSLHKSCLFLECKHSPNHRESGGSKNSNRKAIGKKNYLKFGREFRTIALGVNDTQMGAEASGMGEAAQVEQV